MAGFKPVSISNGAFAFCRYTVAVIFWVALILGSRELVLAGFVILVLSALLKVRKAPLIVLYTATVEKLFPSDQVIVDEKGIRFAHIVGAVVSGLCLLLLYFTKGNAGWIMTGFLALLKTSAALGFCSALKLYNCMNSGSCCRVGKLVRKFKDA
jgi:hypothetical protein